MNEKCNEQVEENYYVPCDWYSPRCEWKRRLSQAPSRSSFPLYYEANYKLPGHPELGLTPGVKFSSGRLRHLWCFFFFFPTWVSYLLNKYRYTGPHVNGVSLANRDKTVICLGSDDSQLEGNDAEAARLAIAQRFNVKLLIDDIDVILAGHPSEYLKGYDVSKTLEGQTRSCPRPRGGFPICCGAVCMLF